MSKIHDLPGELMDDLRDESQLFEFMGEKFPEYLKHGRAADYIIPVAQNFCLGAGLDVGGLECCHFPGAQIVNKIYGGDAYRLPAAKDPAGWDYIFSSHCLEHLENYVDVLAHWRDKLKPGGRLFMYLPHYDMAYWRPKHCQKHVNSLRAETLAEILQAMGFDEIIYSERDLYWSFAVTGVKK